MRIAYLDCFSGMSGDMFLGALVDAGVPVALLERTVAALNIAARLDVSRVERSGITATKVDVYCHGEKDLPREVYWEQQGHKHALEHQRQTHAHDREQQGHEHFSVETGLAPSLPKAWSEHQRDHHGTAESSESRAGMPAPDKHEPSRAGAPAPHSHGHGRGLKEIGEIIRKAAISEGAKGTAIAMFEALASAEARIHNSEAEQVHFHEVGAVDAMVDIVCAAVGAEALGVEEIICSPLNVGGGTVKCAHGTFPVPAPATVELLKGAPVYSSGIQAELVTPTGAAIVKTLAKRFSAFPPMKVEKAGYGAGSRDFEGHANVVRLTVGIGQSSAADAAVDAASRVSTAGNASSDGHNTSQETISVLEANLDDLNPQVFGYVMDRLLEEGALDVFGIPVQMKKSRPGTLLTVLCKPEDASKLAQIIFAETTTLGVRQREECRQVLARRWETVHTRWGDVRLKIASMNGTVTNYAPEYEDCRRIAAEHHVPLKKVMQEATQAYLQGKP
jgi:pyridinium-3,5-bisthiocarboxylic acid mononucleotide nickel chelatase